MYLLELNYTQTYIATQTLENQVCNFIISLKSTRINSVLIFEPLKHPNVPTPSSNYTHEIYSSFFPFRFERISPAAWEIYYAVKYKNVDRNTQHISEIMRSATVNIKQRNNAHVNAVGLCFSRLMRAVLQRCNFEKRIKVLQQHFDVNNLVT